MRKRNGQRTNKKVNGKRKIRWMSGKESDNRSQFVLLEVLVGLIFAAQLQAGPQ